MNTGNRNICCEDEKSATVAPPRCAEILPRIEQIDNRITRLHAKIGELSDELCPVLDEKVSTEAPSPEEANATSPVGEILRRFQVQVENATERLESIRDRLRI